MRPRSKLQIVPLFLLLVLAASVVLAGCSRPAAVRETDATEEPSATEFVQAEAVAEGTTPEPGQTVVSVGSPGAAAEATAPSFAAEATAQPVMEPSPTMLAAAPTVTMAFPTEAVASPVPEATTAPVSGDSEETIVHVVKRGETLYAIALRYGTTVKQIAQANDIADARTIYTGQKLRISTSEGSGSSEVSDESSDESDQSSSGCRVRHRVKRGEWIWQIAREYNVSPYDILAANDLTIEQGRTIQPGLVLCIP
jgi:LysM repeat protein